MKVLWCWRCKAEMPMLDEEEFSRVDQLYGECMNASVANRRAFQLPDNMSMEERFRPVVEAYEAITGLSDLHHNAIMHHRISLFGEPCVYCGKPLRTPNAKLCVACGRTKSTD